MHHGFRYFGKAGGQKSHGACNIDTACPLGDAWRNEIRSVARLQIGGGLLCSGQLVNNLRQDDRRLLLTANHCDIGTIGSPASSVVFYWNYQAATCGGAEPNLNQNTNGATELADDVDSDFSLLQANAVPAGVFFAGWNSSASDVPACGVTVHHPRGHAKSISGFNGATRTLSPQLTPGGPRIQSWEVRWVQGTTEGGSSGGGLWNQNKQIIGQLSGGFAACSEGNPNVDNDQADYYGRLDAGWAELRAFLDPANTGTRALCGKDPGGGACSNPAPVGCPIPVAGGSGDGGGGGGGGGGALSLALLGLLLGARALRSCAAPD